MKRTITLLITTWFLWISGSSQTSAPLTNNDVIKLTKAAVADELIVEFIHSTPVMFDLSREATSGLSGSGVSARVVEAMREAENSRGAGSKETRALGYVAALKLFIPYYEKSVKELQEKIRGWDTEIRRSLLEATELDGRIRNLEAELRLKKSQNPEKFSKEILALKKNLEEDRSNYLKMREKLQATGEKITKDLSDWGSDRAKDLGKEYGNVGDQVKDMNQGPDAGEMPINLSFPGFAINESVVYYLKPATELYYWQQNALNRILELVESWNPKVTDLVEKDASLAEELEPLLKQAESLKSDPKKNKNEISVLKKKISDLEKKRKELSGQMEDDSKELASALKDAGGKMQEALEERFSDIAANMTFAFKEHQL
jgi:chromosome segregation ATPase